MIPVVIVSLRRSAERRESISARLDALRIAFVFHDAVDGNLLTDAEAAHLCPGRASLARRFILSKQEVACLASHMQCLEGAIESGAPFTCILEDDALVDADLAEFLDQAWLATLAPFDVLKLGGDFTTRNDDLAVVLDTHRGRRVCAPLHATYSGIGYIVSRAGARKLLGHARKIQDTLDVCLFRRPAVNARFVDVRPYPVVPAPFRSLIIHDSTFRDIGPWWRPIVTWLPDRLVLVATKLRRFLAFANAQGIHGFWNLERVPGR